MSNRQEVRSGDNERCSDFSQIEVDVGSTLIFFEISADLLRFAVDFHQDHVQVLHANCSQMQPQTARNVAI